MPFRSMPLSNEAATVLKRAQEIAQEHGGLAVTPAILLASLLSQAPSVQALLNHFGIDRWALQAAVEQLLTTRVHQLEPGFSPESRQVVELALREAQALGADALDSIHLLLGLLALGSSDPAVALLEHVGVYRDRVREQIPGQATKSFASKQLSETERMFVEQQRVGRLATVNQKGEPSVVPVCYAYDQETGRFYLPIDEKPKGAWERLSRVRNIRQTGRAALVIDRYDEDWSRLGWVMIRGAARLLLPGIVEHTRALALLRTRYPQYEAMKLEALPVIVLLPDHVASWGALGSAG